MNKELSPNDLSRSLKKAYVFQTEKLPPSLSVGGGKKKKRNKRK